MFTNMVFEWKSCTDAGNGTADGRHSVSPDRFLHGDFSLNLRQAKKEDQGGISATAKMKTENKERGDPFILRLKVKKRSRDRQQR